MGMVIFCGREKMKIAIKWVGAAVACLALLYFGLKFKDQLRDALPLLLESDSLIWCIFGACAVSAQTACAGLAWQRILLILGVSIRSVDAIRILFIAQFARYIPGNIGHHIGKLAMIRSEGVSLKLGALSLLVETVLVLMLGMFLSLVFMPSDFYAYVTQGNWVVPAMVLACLVLAVGVYLLKRGAKAQIIFDAREAILKNWKGQLVRISEIVTYYLINFLFLGWLAWLLATQVFDVHSLSMLQLTSIMAFSWTVGFVAPGAPAGIGVREVIALSLLSTTFDTGVAARLVMLHRLVLTFGDLITFLLGLLMSVVSGKQLGVNKEESL